MKKFEVVEILRLYFDCIDVTLIPYSPGTCVPEGLRRLAPSPPRHHIKTILFSFGSLREVGGWGALGGV